MVLLQNLVATQINCVCASTAYAISEAKRLHANYSLQPENCSQPMQSYCFCGVGFGGVVVDGRGRVADGAEGTAGAATPEDAL